MKKPSINKSRKVSTDQLDIYRKLLIKHGFSVAAVASENETIKFLRYSKLSQVFDKDTTFSVHDVGCGLGHYCLYLKENFRDRKIIYSGSDVVPEFVTYCRKNFISSKFYTRDLLKINPKERYDYLIFGGTFYHKGHTPYKEMQAYVENVLENGFRMSKRGIAFNMLSSFSDFCNTKYFYYPLPKLIEFVATKLSRHFEILHNYPLFEYTVLVYNKDYIKSQHPNTSFRKYFR